MVMGISRDVAVQKRKTIDLHLQVNHLTHSVLSQNGFKAEYKKPGGKFW